jgi:carbamoyl-phosphate synthase large subunit
VGKIHPVESIGKPEINVMLTSVGRRAYLVNYFKEAVGERGKVIATNSNPDATGMLAADVACVVPRANAEGFIESLLDICSRYHVKLLMSLHDWEAPFIAARIDSFKEVGTIPVVSDPHIQEICLDKWATFDFVRRMGWSTPASFVSLRAAKEALEKELIEFPVILKPRRGQGSIGIEVACDLEELEAQYRLLLLKVVRMESNGIMREPEPLIIQQYLSGVDYDLEVVNDLGGRYISVLSKKKLASRAGECELAETVEEQRLTDLGSQIGSRIGHLGVLDVDVIEQDGILYVLEFNPRFGGCYPFSHMAGANLPAAYVAWALGIDPDPSWLHVRPGVKSFKDFALVVDHKKATRG